MAAYLIVNYELTNPADYKFYPPAVLPTLEEHGAEILVAEYQEIIGLRTDNSEGIAVAAGGFDLENTLRGGFRCSVGGRLL